MMTLQEISPAELVGAIEANMAEFWKCFGRLPGAEMHDEPDLLWFATGVPDGSLNGVIHSQFTNDDAASRIDETLEYFGRRRLPMQWWVGPSSRPADLGELLEARGLASRPWRPPGMAVDLDVLPDLPAPPGLEVRRVDDEATVKSWLDASGAQTEALATAGIEPEGPMRHYVGLLEGEPAGASSLMLAAGVASLQLVATVPEARRRGVGTAMSLAPMLDARELGYRIGILASSPLGFGVYSRIGFREYFRWRVYEAG